jgi:hypothetical protein
MAEVERISVQATRRKVQSDQALLICAYEDEAKFRRLKLEGAIPLGAFQARLANLPKTHEIIFYCA